MARKRLPKPYAHLQALADKNEITYETFRARISRGMTPKEAAETPLKRDARSVNIAKKNGISPTTYQTRLRYGWSKERARTEPVRRYRKGGSLPKKSKPRKTQYVPKPKKLDPYTYYKQIAESKGIPVATYNQDIFDNGMSPKEAARE